VGDGKGTMGRLIYTAITSLDGYTADESGSFDWSMPDEEVHTVINEQERAFGIHLYGRRVYEVMVAWETMDTALEPQAIRDYADIWRAADKIVFSSTLRDVASERTRIERTFDADSVMRLKRESSADLTIGGARLAGHALAAGVVDEVRLFVSPVIVGGGTRALPDGVRIDVRLRDERRFDNGVVYTAYDVARGDDPRPVA
jgi:dihydrofolate reductase